MQIQLDNNAFTPRRAYPTDAGLDIMSPIDITLSPHSSAVIDTGVHVELPQGTVGMLKSKSGLNTHHSIVSEGVIDVNYTGSIKVKLYNHGDDYFQIHRGEKITQLVVLPCLFPEVEIVKKLTPNNARGDNGFGSTGR